jgi:hypothetical protein
MMRSRYVYGMRTTVNIDERLLKEAKEAALRTNRTLSEVFAEGVRLVLHQWKRGGRAARTPLVTYGNGGLQPGVDLDDSAALLGVMEKEG